MDETFDIEKCKQRFCKNSISNYKVLEDALQEIERLQRREENLMKLVHILNERIDTLEEERNDLGEGFVKARKLISITWDTDRHCQQ